MPHASTRPYVHTFALALLLAACGAPEAPSSEGAPASETPPAAPVLETAADSVAMQAYAYAGGPAAWAALPALRFDFATERDGARVPIRHHLWDRTTGAYRLDWRNADTLYTALFDVDDHAAGTVYRDNEALADTARLRRALDEAYGAFVNDTYWLLMPTKLFDDGVTRGLDADSSDAETAVLTLQFDGVGLTPGDRYWVYVDRATGAVARWAFRLQSGNEAAFDWTDYQTFDASASAGAAGPIRLATRKESDGGRVLLTDALALPADVDVAAFSDPTRRLDAAE